VEDGKAEREWVREAEAIEHDLEPRPRPGEEGLPTEEGSHD
jgi:hypothetical protein